MRRSKYWIQEAVKRPGSLKQWLKKRYGRRAFTRSGEIKVSYLRKLRKEIKKGEIKVRNKSVWLKRINLALTLKRLAKHK